MFADFFIKLTNISSTKKMKADKLVWQKWEDHDILKGSSLPEFVYADERGQTRLSLAIQIKSENR